MGSLGVLSLVIATTGLVLAVMIILFVTLGLPEHLRQERDQYQPNMMFSPVEVASTKHVDLSCRPLPIVDDVDLNGGVRVLLKDQRDARENGIWITPPCHEAHWTRANDLISSSQILDGAGVFVRQGTVNAKQTFALRILQQRVQRLKPGELDLYFVPMLHHLFGAPHPGHVLSVDAMGVAKWNVIAGESDVVETTCKIPRVLHFVFGLWDSDIPAELSENLKRWTDMNPEFQVHLWQRDRCEALIRAHFWSEWGEMYERACRPALRMDLVRWLILFNEGGYVIDMDTTPTDMMDDSNWCTARVVMLSEGRISEHEAESLNNFAIRKQNPCMPNTDRVTTSWVGSVARHPFIHFVFDHIHRYWNEVGTTANYEITFATGTDALTSVYETYGRDFVDVQMLPVSDATYTHMRLGSWKDIKVNAKK